MSSTATSGSNQPTRTTARAPEPSFAQLMSAASSVSEVNGKRMYKTKKGEMVEMPPEMTLADAVRLETEATEAEKKLGKGPPPLPTPDVEGKVKAKEKKDKSKKEVKPKGKGGDLGKKSAGRGKGGAGDKKGKGAIKGKVGAWLLAKGAPVVAKGESKLKQLKENEQKHDDAATKLSHTQKAVVPPIAEGQSTGNSAQVTNVDSKPAPQPDEQKAKAAFDQAIQENIPRSIEDVDNFKKNNKATQMSAAVAMSVKTDKSAVEGTFSDMKQEPPPVKSDVVPEPLPPEEIAPVMPKMNLGTDTIAPLQPEHTDVSNFTKEGDSKLKEEGVTQEQLDMVDTGDLAEANKEKKGMEKKAKTEPLAVKQFAQQENKKVDASLQQEEAKGKEEIKNERKKQLNATKQKQQGTKSAIEKKREEVANKINDIYKRASEKVTKKLADLETQSMKRFDEGNAQATREFDTNVKQQMDAFKSDRYSGFFGWARRAKDWLLGMDDLPQVKAIFDNNRAIFVTTIDKLSASISEDNKKAVQECKDELVKARAEIKAFVDKLGPDLRDAGQKAQEEMNGKLDALDETVAKKEEDLANKLKDKQTAAIKAIDEKIEKMKEEMSGALAKLGKLLLLAAKKFFTWALEKAGFSLAEIEGIINKGAAVLKAIFTKPIQFVKNLVNAAITGFKNFGKNFLKHLKNALFEWLTGSLEGLTLPAVWDFKGIISVALQMIGISYPNIRRHMVTVMGETVVSSLEKTFTIVKTLVTEGPMAAWEQLKEMAADMRDAFVEAVKDFIKVKIIEQAIQWVVSIFVPGAGIIKAIIGIYDVVMFFIQKAKQIMQMISNFLGSISEIAAGNIGAAADAMENGLARGLSLVINFMAKLLHLDGIAAKIKAAIQKIRDKVDAVLAKVAKWIADKAKALIKKGKDAVKKLVEWWKAKKPFTNKAGEKHTLSFSGSQNSAKLMIATTLMPIEQYLADKKKEHAANPAMLAKIATAEGIINNKNQIVFKQGITPEDEKVQQDKVMAALAEISQALMDLGGGTFKDPDDYPAPKQEPGTAPPKVSEAKFLSKAKLKVGSDAKESSGTHGWVTYVQPKKLSVMQGDKWLQMHLITKQLGGEGIGGNLVAATNSVNSSWRDGIEKGTGSMLAKKADGATKPVNLLWMKTTVDYFSEELEGFKFAKNVKTVVGMYAYKGKKGTVPDFEPIDAPVFSMSAGIPWPELSLGDKASLNKSSGSHLRDRAKVHEDIINGIKRNRPYSKMENFKEKMFASIAAQYPLATDPKRKVQEAAVLAVMTNTKIVVDDVKADT